MVNTPVIDNVMKQLDAAGVKPANKAGVLIAAILTALWILAIRGAAFMGLTALLAPYFTGLSSVSFWASTGIVFLYGIAKGLRSIK